MGELALYGNSINLCYFCFCVLQVRSWLIPIAFTLAFGGMFSKAWRVYSIVIANKTKRKVGIIIKMIFMTVIIIYYRGIIQRTFQAIKVLEVLSLCKVSERYVIEVINSETKLQGFTWCYGAYNSHSQEHRAKPFLFFDKCTGYFTYTGIRTWLFVMAVRPILFQGNTLNILDAVIMVCGNTIMCVLWSDRFFLFRELP